MLHKIIKAAKKRQARYKHSRLIELAVGDLVHINYHRKHSKLNITWQLYYQIIKQNTFNTRNRLTGNIYSNLEHIRLAEIYKWKIPKQHKKYIVFGVRKTMCKKSDTETES